MMILRENKINKTSGFLDRGIFRLFINLRNTTSNQYNELIKTISMSENIFLQDIICEIEKESIIIKDKNRSLSRYDNKLNIYINEKFNLEKLLNEIVTSDINMRHICVIPGLKDEDESVISLQYKLFDLNSIVTYIVNKLYLDNCKSNNTVPNGSISVPEHLINEIFLSKTKEKAQQNLIAAVNSYIDSNGMMYDNCYQKVIQGTAAQTQKIDGILDQRFTDLVQRYHQKFSPGKIQFPKECPNKALMSYKLLVASRFVSRWIHPDMLKNVRANIKFDSELCEKDGSLGFYSKGLDQTYLHEDAPIGIIVHEILHEIVVKAGLKKPICDFMYEKTKGDNIYKKGKFLYKLGISPLDAYSGKMQNGFEEYSDGNELLSSAIDYLFNGIDGYILSLYKKISNADNYGKISEYIDKEIDRIVKTRLNSIYNRNPDLGLFILTFFKGNL